MDIRPKEISHRNSHNSFQGDVYTPIWNVSSSYSPQWMTQNSFISFTGSGERGGMTGHVSRCGTPLSPVFCLNTKAWRACCGNCGGTNSCALCGFEPRAVKQKDGSIKIYVAPLASAYSKFLQNSAPEGD